MSTSALSATHVRSPDAKNWGRRNVAAWFAVTAVGQIAFVYFILAFYGVRTIEKNFAGWDDKPLIEGYVAGDPWGNLMFITHVLMAIVITLGGLHQLVPVIRKRWPLSHRLVGRTFVLTAYFMACSGLWLTWFRGTHLSLISGIATSINAVLIIAFVTAAWMLAWRRRFSDHRRWALRAFVVANGVWFFRVGIMAWVIINQGPVGMNETLSGPADIALSFGSYLLPLGLLELYFVAQRSSVPGVRRAVTGAIAAGTLITMIGVFGTVAFMWGPYL